MKNTVRLLALALAAIFALSALACSGGSGSGTTQPPITPYKEAMMPPIKWSELGDTEMLKVTAFGSTKTYTAAQLYALDRGQLVGYDSKNDDVRDSGDPMYFCGVYMKGLLYDVCGTLDFEDFEIFKLIGVDGSETNILDKVDSSNLHESVLALQRGAVVTDAQSGCMLVLKSTSGNDRNNWILKGIAEIVIG